MNNLKKMGIIFGILAIVVAVVFSVIFIANSVKISNRYNDAAEFYSKGKIEQALIELDMCERERFAPSAGMQSKINMLKSEIFVDMNLYRMAEKYLNLAINGKTPTLEQEQLREKIMKGLAELGLNQSLPTIHDDSSGTPKTDYAGTIERYYDYSVENPQISMLFEHEPGTAFIDDEMAAFALVLMHRQGRIDFENGNPKEEYNEVTERYFGKKIVNFDNNKSTVISGTDMVISTGWGYSRMYLILKELEEAANDVKTGVFYTIFENPGDDWIAGEVKSDLLDGNFTDYGNLYIVELSFRELYDENGDMYFQFLDAQITPDSGEPVKLYGDE